MIPRSMGIRKESRSSSVPRPNTAADTLVKLGVVNGPEEAAETTYSGSICVDDDEGEEEVDDARDMVQKKVASAPSADVLLLAVYG